MKLPTLYSIRAIVILDVDGKRILAKYYDDAFPNLKSKTEFEDAIFKKFSKNPDDEITLFEGSTVLCKTSRDLLFYVVGDSEENELLLLGVLNCLYESIEILLNRHVEKRALMDKLNSVFLIVDEICEGGIFLESDATSLFNRIGLRPDDIPLGEQTVAQALQNAKEQFKISFNKL